MPLRRRGMRLEGGGQAKPERIKLILTKKRKAGKKRAAGRPSKTVSKASESVRRRIVEQAARENKELPLDYMLRVMRDPDVEDGRRDDMAKAAAPYMHAKLASMTIVGDPNKPLYSRVERVIVKSGAVAQSGSDDAAE